MGTAGDDFEGAYFFGGSVVFFQLAKKSEGDVTAVSKAKILNKRDFAWVQRGTIQGLRLVTIFRVRLVANCREALCVP